MAGWQGAGQGVWAGAWVMGPGSWVWVQGPGSWVWVQGLGSGSWVQGLGSKVWVLGPGSWVWGAMVTVSIPQFIDFLLSILSNSKSFPIC